MYKWNVWSYKQFAKTTTLFWAVLETRNVKRYVRSSGLHCQLKKEWHGHGFTQIWRLESRILRSREDDTYTSFVSVCLSWSHTSIIGHHRSRDSTSNSTSKKKSIKSGETLLFILNLDESSRREEQIDRLLLFIISCVL